MQSRFVQVCHFLAPLDFIGNLAPIEGWPFVALNAVNFLRKVKSMQISGTESSISVFN